MKAPSRMGWILGCLVLAWSAAAVAAPASYECEGGAELTADFSPRAAQVRFEGKHWTLHRVRDSREARYVAAREGVAIMMVRNQATLERKGQAPLACKLVVRALRETSGAGAAAGSTPR